MTKKQVRKTFIKLDANQVIEEVKISKEHVQRMIDGQTRYLFDVNGYEEKRIGFIEWDTNTSSLNAFCVPESILVISCSMNNSKKWEKLSW